MLIKQKKYKAIGIQKLPKQILRGVSQIMLQENALTGLIFLIGIGYGSLNMALATLLASFSGTMTAYLLKFDKENIEKGLYGFSAALVGAGLLLFFKSSLTIWTLILLGGSLACVFQEYALRKKLPIFTFPFILIVWGTLLLVKLKVLGFEASVQSANTQDLDSFHIFRNYGQVIFQDKVFSGILFFLAVLINSPIHAIYGFVASGIAYFLALFLGIEAQYIDMGLIGFNAVLSAIVFASRARSDIFWGLAATILSTLISILFIKLEWIQLTFPFVVASAALSILKNKAAS